ncbi:MAG: glutamate-5-semialdehyde dehydrogenase [Desulforegulaceae bacterium]|nr:glutamate-5-semialdehyde dehydrogenase [Desulforegulaceae bacterium]
MEKLITEIAQSAKNASRKTAILSTDQKNKALKEIKLSLEKNYKKIQEENLKDIEKAREEGLSSAMIDRLTLSDNVMNSMISGIDEVILLDDPVGRIGSIKKRPNGLEVGRMNIPIGVIGMIYESRPNVTIDAGVLCLKAGNAVILRGGTEAFHSNQILGSAISEGLENAGLDKKAIQIIPVKEREAVDFLLNQEGLIDLMIPRGGEGLIRFVTENSSIPVLKHYKGVCHVYIDKFAELEMAIEIAFNSKVQRPGVCNAMETLLVHKDIADKFLPHIGKLYNNSGVEIKGCPKTCEIIKEAALASQDDFGVEFLDLKASIKVVDSFNHALDHISVHNSGHTESIVTKDYSRARRFLREVDSSVVLVNASTRFNDGNQLGLGAEIGISTDKLHAYGPMGIEELTARKFIVFGDGQIRN